MNVQSLVEDLKKVGAGDLDFIADIAGVQGGGPAKPAQSGPSIDESVDSLYKEIRAEVHESQIDYDKNEFETDLRAAIKERLEAELSKGTSLEEAFKVIRKLVGGSLKRARIQKLTGGEKLAARQARRKNRASIRISAKRYRRKSTTKRREKKRATLKSRMGESKADELRGLLSESQVEAAGLSDAHEDVLEAYERIGRIAALLGDFFESFGDDNDTEIAKVMDEMIEGIEAREATMLEGKVSDAASEIPRIQSLVKVLGRALETYGQYNLSVDEAPEGK
jgi:hypothetical protein